MALGPKGRRHCDPWKETEWHRAWKRSFPEHTPVFFDFGRNELFRLMRYPAGR